MKQSPARACILTFAKEFEEMFVAAGRPRLLPHDLEDRALAILLVCAEREDTATGEEIQAVDRCIAALEAGPEAFGWKILPFALARSLLGSAPVDPTALLHPYLTHPTSAVREYVFVMGWLIRKHLRPSDLTAPLMLNVENTLGCWIESLQLCRGLYPDESEFWRMVDRYQPTAMPQQFNARIASIRPETHFIESPGFLLRHEARIQKMLVHCLFRAAEEPDPVLH